MWRQIKILEDNEYGDIYGISCQCLNRGCKKFFIRSQDCDEKFCPHCGQELGKEFTKKNPRYILNNWKYHYPWLQFYILKDVGQRELLAKDGFYAVPNPLYKQKLEWQTKGCLFPIEFVMGERPKIEGIKYFQFQFRKHLKLLRKDFVNDCIKIVIKRWDKTEKVMYGHQFK